MPIHEAVTPDMIELPVQVVKALDDMIERNKPFVVAPKRVAAVVLAALANDPMVPKEYSLANEAEGIAIAMFKELQRSAFLRKEEPLPDEVRALLWKTKQNTSSDISSDADVGGRLHNEAINKAYRLGLAKGKESK